MVPRAAPDFVMSVTAVFGRRCLANYEAKFHPCLRQGFGRMRHVVCSTLLYGVQLLVEPYRRERHQEYSRPYAEHAHRDCKPIDFGQ